MIDDLRRLEGGTTYATDICLIGAGAAGITIARELADSKLRVCLVESGEFELESETQALYEGESVGHPCMLEFGRLRMFGGTTNHWGGRCVTLDPLDFTARDWVPYSGWPISAGTLDPFYRRAHEVCGFKSDWWTDEETRLRLGVTLPPLDSPWLRPYMWRIPNTMESGVAWNWGVAYRDILRRAQNVRVLLHANLTRLESHANGKEISAVTVTSLSGVSLRIEAKVFILCCGAIENARILLVGAEQTPELPLNRNDLVGRYFQQHPRGRSGRLVTDDAASGIQDIFNVFNIDPFPSNVLYDIGLGLSERAQREHGLLNGSAHIIYSVDPASSWNAAKNILWELQAGRLAPDIGEQIRHVAGDLGSIARNLRRHLAGRRPLQPLLYANIVLDLEQAPDPLSRITLSAERDPLGLPRVRADWRIGVLEQRTAKAFTVFMAAEFARLHIGRTQLDTWLEEGAAISDEAVIETYHYIGTTRMADDPRRGVVDADCRVHGILNLFVAGSSVFPTGGTANPTLTIVALALRLSDHLKSKLG